MGSTPITPAAQSAALPTKATSILTEISGIFKLHERLLIFVIAIVLTYFCYGKGIAYLASRDQLNANKATVVLQAQADVNAKEATDVKQMQLAYQQLAQQIASRNQTAVIAQQKEDAATATQQTADKTLPPPELAARWTTLLKVLPETVQPSGSVYSVTPETATATVVQLESIPQLQSDLDFQKTMTESNGKLSDSEENIVKTLNSQVDGLNVQIADESKACVAQVAAVKAQARKSKLHWFEIGVGVGFIAREAIKISTGL